MDYIGVTAKFPWNRGRIWGQTNVLYGLCKETFCQERIGSTGRRVRHQEIQMLD